MDLLITLLLLPVAGALLILFPPVPPGWARPLAMATAGISLLFSLALYGTLDFSSAAIQLYSDYPWNPRLGTSFSFGVDGISWPLVVLTNLLTLLAISVSGCIRERIKAYYLLLLLLETATMGVFLAQSWALLYVFWELVLIPLFFLIDRWGGSNRQTAALNFVLYTMGGSIFMLLSLLLLFDANPEHSFLFTSMQAAGVELPVDKQTLIFLGLLIGFGVKMPLFPLHGWLPLAYTETPSPVTIILAGILGKMGAYGLIRSAATLPDAALYLQNLLLTLGLTGVIYGGLLAWRQSDMKRMIAYSSVSHMGMVIVGIASLNPLGVLGASYQMVAHSLVAAALFMLIGLLHERTQTRNIEDYGSLLRLTPTLAFLMIIAFIGGVGMPGTAGFIAELHTLIGGFQRWQWLIALLSIGVLITATYSLRTVKQLYTGPASPNMQAVADLTLTESLAAGSLVAATLILGFAPAPLLDVLTASVTRFASLFGV